MTLFCDFDGPIVDVSGRYHGTYRLALARTRRLYRTQGKELQLTPMTKVQFWHMKQARIPDLEIALRSGLRDGQIDDFLAQVKEIVNCCPALLRRDSLQPQVPAALQLLKQHHIKLVLVTLRCQDQVNQFLRRYDLEGAFTGIYCTQEAQAAYDNYTDLKTSLLSQALTDHGDVETAWMVGDTEADVIAAQRLEVSAIALTCGIRSRSYLSRLQPTSLQPNLLAVAKGLSNSLVAAP
jgi:phosphoglycolate phosphatase